MKSILTLPTWTVFLFLIIPSFLTGNSYAELILAIIWAALLAYCIYFLGNSLYRKLPEGHDLKIRWFNFTLFFAIAYLIFVLLAFDGGYQINQDNYKEYGWKLAIIIPCHLFTMYSMFYAMWFIAKAIATVENKKAVGFDKYAGNFFLLWILPIGIWWVHPKVRKIFLANT